MTEVFFISEEYLKTNTAINENVDSGELRFCILTSQNINIQETLGQPLFEEIQLQVSGNTLTPDNRYLLDKYIVPATTQWAYYHGLDNFFVKWVNVGLVQNRNEQGSNIDIRTFKYLKDNARSTAEFYDTNMRRWLCAKSNLYPKYNVIEIGKIMPERGSANRRAIAMRPTNFWPNSWYGPVPSQITGAFPAQA
jgi:hypothetical protein